MTEPADLPLWPDTVENFYADRACSIRSATRRSWGYTYRWLQRLHPTTPVGGFRTDDLVAFVTQRGRDGPRWASATARNYHVALQRDAPRRPATARPHSHRVSPATRLCGGDCARIDGRCAPAWPGPASHPNRAGVTIGGRRYRRNRYMPV